ncbi:TetR family transcriptional regulator [Streptomyces sp. NPDC085460]|uniref:TetR family transcriptional regulator n=1 Tax=Streptomyces sp. NPDC085460 TaxID=3365723 RepID=UPI0037D2862B
MTQERAARTRATLIRTAAVEFDRHGYAGTSLSRISKAAGLSTGALTFHFERKEDLADAVIRRAGQLVGVAPGEPAPVRAGREPLGQIGDLVSDLMRSIHEYVEVRSSIRLELDRPDAGVTWSAHWFATVRRLAQQARLSGQLPGRLSPEQVEMLVAHFVYGTGYWIRGRQARVLEAPREECGRLWASLWEGFLDSSRPLGAPSVQVDIK